MEKNLVSVIIPAYNCASFLKNAVDSVLQQTYSNFELLIINDGSTDYTPKLAEALKSLDNRIRVFHKQNGGLSDARNYGIERAKGDYLAFLDADDNYHPEYIEELLKVIKLYKVPMAACGYISRYPDGTMIKSKVFQEPCCLNREEATIEFSKNQYFTAHAWAKLYHRSIFSEIRYPKGRYYEDIFVLPQILELCQNIGFSNQWLIDYNQIADSITHKLNPLHEYDAFEATYIKFNTYNYLPGVYSYLVKEPVEIALRLKKILRKQYKDEQLTGIDVDKMNKFIDSVKFRTPTYKKLSIKFRFALLFSDFI